MERPAQNTATYLFSNSDLRKLIVPLVLEQLLAITVGMADTMMISSAGEAAISGVSLVDIINVMITGILTSLATGGAVVISQFIGERKLTEANRASKQLMYTATAVGCSIMLLVLLFRGPFLRLFYPDVSPEVMESALLYLSITAIAYPFIAAYHAGAAIFRSARNSQITFKISAFINVLNVIGNAVCVLGLGMGVAGVAIPSLLSHITGSLIMYTLLRNPNRLLCLRKEPFQLDMGMIRRILYIGVPSGVENGLFQLGRVLVVSIVSGFGTVEIAANGIANNLDTLGLLLGFAINLATITVIGQCVGAGDEAQVRYYTKKILRILYVSAAILNLLLILFLDQILLIYQVTPETRALAKILVLIHNGCAILLWPVAFTLPNMLRACNDVTYTMVTGVFAMFAFRIGLGYVFGVVLGYGSVGVWVAMIGDWLFRTACYLYRYWRGTWRKYAHFA